MADTKLGLSLGVSFQASSSVPGVLRWVLRTSPSHAQMLGCASVLEHLPGTREALDFSLSLTINKKIPSKDRSGMVVYSCNRSTQEAEGGGW